jgi:hypothetical protein
MRNIGIDEAFAIVQRVYGAFGWKPDHTTTRDERNVMLESSVACVHYGHATFNPNGGDPRWCIKSAGGGRPQSDDIIVLSPTREYWDLIPNAGAANWYFNLGAHSEPLPGEQQVYPPSQASLPGGVVDPGPGPDPGPDPGPTPPPESETERLILIALGNLHGKVDQVLVNQQRIYSKLEEMESQQAKDTGQVGNWMVEQAEGTIKAIVGVNADGTTGAPLGPRIDNIADSQCVLKKPLRR